MDRAPSFYLGGWGFESLTGCQLMNKRKPEKRLIHYIYKTVCTVTERYYIGMHSTDDINDNYLGSGLQLKRSIKKYGARAHSKSILEFCESRDELKHRERQLINSELIGDILCMNLMIGGEGGFELINNRLAVDKEFRECINKKLSRASKESFDNGRKASGAWANKDEYWHDYKLLVKNSDIDFTCIGWANKVSKIIGISPQKTRSWMARYLPEIQCHRRNSPGKQ